MNSLSAYASLPRKPGYNPLNSFLMSVPGVALLLDYFLYMSFSMSDIYYAQWQQAWSATYVQTVARIVGTPEPGSRTVAYTYEYQGKTYTGNLIRFRLERTGGRKCSFITERNYSVMQPGAEISAFVDPAHPERAVLEKGLLGADLMHFWLAATMLMIGASAK